MIDVSVVVCILLCNVLRMLFVLVCGKVYQLELVSSVAFAAVDSSISLVSQYMTFLPRLSSSCIQLCRCRIPLQLATAFQAFEFLI